MSEQPVKDDISLNVLRSWGRALVKTGIEHLDLGMVRRGRQRLKEVERREADADVPKR